MDSVAGLSVKLSQVSKIYPGVRAKSATTALDELSFDVQPGEAVSLVGQTGCGKSTLFRLVAGLEAPTQGSVEVAGRNPHEDFQWFRGRVSIIFQDDRLLPWRTAIENASLGLEVLGASRQQQRRQAALWLRRLGLEGSEAKHPGELSGGMRQRVAMARALVIQPQLVLADEAFGHLDEVTGARLRDDFLRLCRSHGTTVIMVTHQLDEAITAGDRIIVLGKPGRVIAEFHSATELESGTQAELRQKLQKLLQSD